MSKLLQINAGVFGDQSQSTKLANQFASQWQAKNENGQVVVRDLISAPLPHLDSQTIMAFQTAESERSSEQQAIVSLSDQLIAEIQQADAIVIGLPMYNFDIPSQLKSYFDHLARAGVTFTYTENGPVGLLDDKPVYIMAARGGVHLGMPTDTQTGFVKTFLGFIGLKHVEFVYAEGLNMGEPAQASAIEQAEKAIGELV